MRILFTIKDGVFMKLKSNFKYFLISILISLGVGGLSALLTMGNMEVYNKLNTPPLSPPSILFPIVWSILFVFMGISSALVYKDRSYPLKAKEKALAIYGLSLFFNFFWSIIFFNLQNYAFAFIWILVLWVLILLTITNYYKINKTAALLQIPYLLWVSFASYLNLGIAILN